MTRDVLDIFYGTREIINFSMGVLVILFCIAEMMVMLRACSLIDTSNQANRVEDAIQDKSPKEMLLFIIPACYHCFPSVDVAGGRAGHSSLSSDGGGACWSAYEPSPRPLE
jgi:hypothetical protein